MDEARSAVESAQLVVYGALAVAAVGAWRRTRETSSAWLATTFGLLALIVAVGTVLPDHSNQAFVEWARKLLVAGLLLFPYCLYRFATSFEGPRVQRHRLAIALTAGVVLGALVVPRFPEPGEARPSWMAPYIVALALQWTVVSYLAAQRLWGAGAGQGSLTRRRMRMMALGSVVLNVALLVAVSAPSGDSDGVATLSGLLGYAAAGFFYLGFAPPGFLRVVWRQPDALPIRDTEVALMGALTVREVADHLLPNVTRLLGGKGSLLADPSGRVLASHNLSAAEAAAIAASAAEEEQREPVSRRDLMASPMRHGWLAVRSSRYTPVFGREEIELLAQLATFADLALDRASLFEQERSSRRRAEEANAEVETFVYSVSHDLKSPLVSLVGFLEFLRADLGETAPGDVGFYLDRMDAGVRYMEALIQDLLELSRIGRVQTDTADVDLGRVVREIVAELAPGRPDATVEVGELPVLHMNPLRVRQLFTNLVGNALVHSGRADVTVRVASAAEPDGGVRITVADDGKGIPAAYREKVFRVFERLERSTDDSGTGIGLAVCRKIVEQAGGVIGLVDSGVGAAFEIVLPASVVTGQRARLEAAR